MTGTPASTAPAATRTIARLESVDRVFGSGPTAVTALSGIELSVGEGQLLVVLGPSGSGKTTLLNLLGAIDTPTSGRLVVDGHDVAALDAGRRTALRRDTVGFVFQFFNLIPTLTARENIALVAELTGHDDTDVDDVLHRVGLADRGDHFPGQLSGGEQQRVAIARALAKEPRLLLCDEPTGALDAETGRDVLALLQDLARQGRTVVMVTHNAPIARIADRVLRMRSGRIVADEWQDDPADAETLEW